MGKSIVADCTRVNGSVVLSTCNRFEVYLDVDLHSDLHENDGTTVSALSKPNPVFVDHATKEIAHMIATASQVDAVGASGAFTVRSGVDVVEHLFEVATGLDSLVVGEREIAGQVRRALSIAHTDSITTGGLERLFQRALHASKKVANQTQLAADGRSVVSVALGLAAPSLPPWGNVAALVVGTGAYAGATVAALRSRGVRDISVYSGSGRAEEFGASHGVIPAFDLVAAMIDADIVVCCSGTGRGLQPTPEFIADESTSGSASAPQSTVSYVLNAASVVAARRARAQRAGDEARTDRAQVVIDLALHKDADPRIGDVESVLLIDLNTVRANAPDADTSAVETARNVLDGAVSEFAEAETQRIADAEIKGIVEKFSRERAHQISQLVDGGVDSASAAKAVSKILNPLMNKEIVTMKAIASQLSQNS